MAAKISSFLIVVALLSLTCFSALAQTFKNPILSTTSPDPFVTRLDGFYYMVLSDSHRELSVLKSDKLSNWRSASRKVVYTAPPEMDNLYAPEIHLVQGQVYIYFTMDDGVDDNHRMYVIQAKNRSEPDGEYGPPLKMKIDPDYFAIDGTVLEHRCKGAPAGLYFLWSGWENATLGGEIFNSIMFIAKMQNATHLLDNGRRTLLKKRDVPWEGRVIEGPQILRPPTGDRTLVVHSAANTWDETYCLTVLYIEDCKDPLLQSNWIRPNVEPVFAKNVEEDVHGPGHASFTTSPDGAEDWIVYHAMNSSLVGTNRTARAQKFTWNSYGLPDFGVPRGFNTELPLPSGEVPEKEEGPGDGDNGVGVVSASVVAVTVGLVVNALW